MKALRLLLSICIILLSQLAFAGEEVVSQIATGDDISTADMTVQDDWFGQTGAFSVKRRAVEVSLYKSDAIAQHISSSWTLYVQYSIELKFANGSSQNKAGTLSIEGDHLSTATVVNLDKEIYEGVSYGHLVVNSVTFLGAGSSVINTIPDDFHLELKAITERYHTFTPSAAPVVASADALTDNTLLVSWDYLEGAEAYDLEWVFVADGGTGHQTASIEYDFENATRVQISDNKYAIPLAGPEGSFIYRVRGLAYDLSKSDYKNSYIYGNWSYNPSAFNISEAMGDHSGTKCYYYSSGVDINKNWTYTTTFAEEGKRKEVAAFVDGSGRTRQMVTVVNSDNNAIVAETKYDRVGREAVSILPTPVPSQGIKYYGSASTPFNGSWGFENFDSNDHLDQSNTTLPEPLPTGAKSREYYSSSNPLSFINKDAIPEGGSGYTYSMTQFTNDGTNRPRVTTGVGDALRYKAQDHHNTKYYYVTPTQADLDRIFGSEVGYNDFYQKVIVVDPNGQQSIQYQDNKGRTIATALSGAAPSNLVTIDNNSSATINSPIFTSPKSAGNSATVQESMNFGASSVDPVTINYELLQNNFVTCRQAAPATPIEYDLTIQVLDERGVHVDSASFFGKDSRADGSLFNFTPSIGSYTITRTISVNQAAKQTFLDNEETLLELYREDQSCVGYPYYYVSGDTLCADYDCSLACLEAFTYEVDGEVVYLDGDGLEYVKDPASGDYFTSLSPTVLWDESNGNAPFNIAISECIVECENDQDTTVNTDLRNLFADDRCDMRWKAITFDMSPGGQYMSAYCDTLNCIKISNEGPATYDSLRLFYNGYNDTTWLYDVTTNSNGELCLEYVIDQVREPLMYLDGVSNLVYDAPETLTRVVCSQDEMTPLGDEELTAANNVLGSRYESWAELRANWQEGYADSLVSLHPEYCAFNFFCNYSEACHGQGGNLTMDIVNDYQGMMYLPTSYDAASNFEEDGREYNFMNPLGFEENSSNDQFYFMDGVQSELDPLIACSTQDQNTLSGYAEEKLTEDLQQFLLLSDDNGNPIDYVSVWYLLDDPDQISDGKGGNNSGLHPKIVELFNKFHGDGICQQGLIQSNDDKLTYFRSIYLFFREKVIYDYFDNVFLCEDGEPYTYWDGDFDGDAVIDETGYVLNFPRNPLFALADNPSDPTALAQIGDQVDGLENSIEPTPQDDCSCSQWQDYLWNNGLNGASNQDIADYLNNEFCTGYTADDIADVMLCVSGTNMVYVNLLPDDITCDFGGYFVQTQREECEANKARLAKEYADERWERLKAAHMDSISAAYDKAAIEGIYQNETVKLGYTQGEYHYTLYYYDLAGNLVKTVPPKGVDLLSQTEINTVHSNRTSGSSTSTKPNHQMATNYRYNTQNQLKVQYTPDAGKTEFWYDSENRLVASQNAKQATVDKYSYTLYDGLGRIVESGQIQGSTLIDTVAASSTGFFNWLTAASSREEVTLTIYDEPIYDLAGTGANEDKIEQAFGIKGQNFLRNRVSSSLFIPSFSGSQVYKSGSYENGGLPASYLSYSSATHFSYDPHGNVEVLVQDMSNTSPLTAKGRRFFRMEYEYDLVSGNVNEVAFQPGLTDQFYHRYEYDADNRIVNVETSRDRITWHEDARYFYYPHGPVSRVELGDKNIQGLDYAYTLQGWLKSVNGSSLGEGATRGTYDLGTDSKPDGNPNQAFAQDAFAFQLDYFKDGANSDYTPIGSSNFIASIPASGNAASINSSSLYNGNIARMLAVFNDNTESPQDVAMNTYRYDQLNRIRQYDSYSDPGINSGNAVSTTSNFGYAATYNYDENGNLTDLSRENASGSQFDDFTYSYKNDPLHATYTNKLDRVNDSGTDMTDDIKNGQSAGNYQYDEIGNLISDSQEGISSITWNLQGKVSSVVKSGTSISFKYDPFGNRISKAVNNAGTVTTTYYVRDAQGNTMATYKHIGSNLTLEEVNLYGSDRIGQLKESIAITNDIMDASDDDVFLNLDADYELQPATGGAGIVAVEMLEAMEYTLLLKALKGTITFYTSELAILDGTYTFNGDVVSVPAGGNIVVRGSSNFNFSGISYGSIRALAGSVRLGNFSGKYKITQSQSEKKLGTREFELKNHLGNVLAVVNDKPLVGSGNSYAEADVISAQDYYPFGMIMPGRKYNSNDHRYGFNGMEKDDQIKDVEGSHYTSEWRQYDSRLGRWFSIDPVNTAGQSPYANNNNNPVLFKDPKGNVGVVGGLIGAAVGAVAEVVSQTVANGMENLSKGNGFFDGWSENMDWADVAISAGEGAIIGATGGTAAFAFGVKAVGAAARTSVDLRANGQGLDVIGIDKEWESVKKDGIGEAFGLLLALPGDFSGGIFKEGLGGDLLGGVTDGLVSGVLNGAYAMAYNGLSGKKSQIKLLDNNDVEDEVDSGNEQTHGGNAPTMQKGAYSVIERAQAIVDKLKEAGIEAWVVVEGGLYKVKINKRDAGKADEVIPNDKACCESK